MDEFLARLRAAVRRGAAASDTDEPVIETSSFTVDLAAKKVTKNGTEVHLTPTEWGMLEMLVRNRGKLVGREELLKEVWGPAYAKETHYLRVYLAQLRRKLEDDPSRPGAPAHRSRNGLPIPGVTFGRIGAVVHHRADREARQCLEDPTAEIGVSIHRIDGWFGVSGSVVGPRHESTSPDEPQRGRQPAPACADMPLQGRERHGTVGEWVQ